MGALRCVAAQDMDDAHLLEVALKYFGGFGLLAGVVYGVGMLIRKLNIGASADSRAYRAETEIFKNYKELLDQSRNEILRLQGKTERLETELTKHRSTLTVMQIEHREARRDRNEFAQKLAEIKELQTQMVEGGELTSPLLDIPSAFVRRFQPTRGSE